MQTATYIGPNLCLKGKRALVQGVRGGFICGKTRMLKAQFDDATLESHGRKWGFGWHKFWCEDFRLDPPPEQD